MEAKETAGMLACALAASHERAREPLGEQVVLQLDHQPEHHVARQLHHRDRQVPA